MSRTRPFVRAWPTLKTLWKSTTPEARTEPGGRELCPLESCCRMHFRSTPTTCARSSSTAANLPELVTEIEDRFPALRQHLRGEDGQIRRFINFYVNEEDIRFLGNEKYSFQEGDEVLVIPSIAGGCE